MLRLLAGWSLTLPAVQHTHLHFKQLNNSETYVGRAEEREASRAGEAVCVFPRGAEREREV